MRLLLFFPALLMVLFHACSGGPKTPMQQAIELADLPQDFLSFYDEFHKDSAYQIAHIEWPLKGERSVQVDSSGSKKILHTWDSENWSMLRLPDMSDVGLKRSFETISDVLVIEKMQYPMVNYGLERQFFKEEDGSWKLIFYSEMQELN